MFYGSANALTHAIRQCQRAICGGIELLYYALHRIILHGQRGSSSTSQDGLYGFS